MWAKAGRLLLLVAGAVIAITSRRKRPGREEAGEVFPIVGSGDELRGAEKLGGDPDPEAAKKPSDIRAVDPRISRKPDQFPVSTSGNDDGPTTMSANENTDNDDRFETDHPVAASRESSDRLKGRETAPPVEKIKDPLEEKHKAGAFDRDFRTVDYSQLSEAEASRERERMRRKRDRSSWHPATRSVSDATPAAAGQAQFSAFGGSMVSAEVVRGKSDERVIDMMPTLAPGAPAAKPDKPQTIHAERRAKLAFSNPDGPTPGKEDRRLPPDPLAEKHKAEKFDNDFRTIDYRHLGKKPAGPRDKLKIEPDGIIDKESLFLDEQVEAEPQPGAFRTSGAQAPLVTIAQDGGENPHTTDAEPPVGASAPQGLPAPRCGNPDDLTRIEGIGTAIERLLFDRGLYHFDQIAGLQSHEVVWLEQELGFPGRVAEERWIEQARHLVEG